jgi:hypothetical protein
VLDDPEQLTWCVEASRVGQIWRSRIQPLGEIAALDAGRAVAPGAMLGVVGNAGYDLRGIVKAIGAVMPDACARTDRSRTSLSNQVVTGQWG